MKTSLLLFFLCLVIPPSIWEQDPPARETEVYLIEQLAEHDLVKASIEDNEALIISSQYFCEIHNCKEYFSQATTPIEFYTKKEMLKRKIITYVVIKKMDVDQEVPILVAELVLRNKSIAIVIRKE